MPKLRNRYLTVLILIHILVVFGITMYVVMSRMDYHGVLLVGDNYYDIAKEFVRGDTLLHKFRGPVLPLLFSILFVFPESMHPFVRLLISVIFSVGTIILVFSIAREYMSEKACFLGSLIFILNPVYVHWTVRPYPEIFIAFFLAFFISNIINYFRTNKVSFLVHAILAFFVSFFIKPVFLFIPMSLLVAAIVIKSRKAIIISLLLVVVAIFAYHAQDKFTEIRYDSNVSRFERTYTYVHKALLIADSYWVDYVLRTRQFFKPTLRPYTIPYRDNKSLDEYGSDWVKTYFQKYPKGNLVFMNLYFICDKPILVLQKLLISPLFFFSMSARTSETFVKLFFSIVSVVLAAFGLRVVLRTADNRKEIILIGAIVAGYILLHLVTHAINRYSLPILPFLYIWGGVPVVKLINRVCGSSHVKIRKSCPQLISKVR